MLVDYLPDDLFYPIEMELLVDDKVQEFSHLKLAFLC